MEPENILKGRMAESLVEELLKKSGNKVYRFGYEAVLQNLTQLEKAFDRENEVGERIRSIPDFIVINKQGKPFFVEVKFRTDLTVYNKDIKQIGFIEKFWKAKIIVLTVKQPYFRVSNSPYLNEKQAWNLISLRDDRDFDIPDDSIKACDALAEKYYKKRNSKDN
ncbi:MAG: hypothetical protein HY458_02325 [Parcubacteria group bacterium]|nr:hypothetical protein [Parcubacteria group bacterium]